MFKCDIIQVLKNMKTIRQKLNIFIIVLLFGFAFSVNANTIPEANTLNVEVKTFEATVYGTVRPNGLQTTAWVEYSTDFNMNTYTESNHIYVGTQNSNSPIRINLKNLKADTIYYARMVADNGRIKTEGNILLFKTNPRIENQTVTIVNTNTTGGNNTSVQITNDTRPTNTAVNTNTEIITKTIDVVVPSSNIILQDQNFINTNQNNNTNWIYDNNTENNLSANTGLISLDTKIPGNLFEWIIVLLLLILIVVVIKRIFY